VTLTQDRETLSPTPSSFARNTGCVGSAIGVGFVGHPQLRHDKGVKAASVRPHSRYTWPGMLLRQFQLPLAWLCLIWFSLTHTLFASGMVICHDGSGVSRVEWACERNGNGECLGTACSPCSESDPASPCQDTPVKGDAENVKAPPRSLESVIVALFTAAIALWTWTPQPQFATRVSIDAERPPGALSYIRSVVLLV
jgi:hypothetical protein